MHMVPDAWLPKAAMKRIINHWTAGTHKANATDREHYHLLIEGDGKLVRGDHEISDNVNTGDGDYAAHTRGANTGAIGVSICCMGGADVRESNPYNPGRWPPTMAQWETLVAVNAELCAAYGIPVTPETVLSHAEVEGTLGIKQAGKWDFTRLPFFPETTARAIGDRFRKEVVVALRRLQGQPTTGPLPPPATAPAPVPKPAPPATPAPKPAPRPLPPSAGEDGPNWLLIAAIAAVIVAGAAIFFTFAI